jgi:hypothetical protein
MPIYVFIDTETEEEFEDILTFYEKEDLLKKNPHIKQLPTSFGIVTGLGSVYSKTDNTWKEVLSKIAENHPGSDLADKYGQKTHSEVKTREVIKKHKDKWKHR